MEFPHLTADGWGHVMSLSLRRPARRVCGSGLDCVDTSRGCVRPAAGRTDQHSTCTRRGAPPRRRLPAPPV
jgi:hypothetical protein